eukprot:TRINITY_DN677_c0_g3_i1.p1 TRINITY_DN677_c0_g3~~TRINITY_DN677_c0_g3_i1.p1  ORF type:complete len:411 (+),score=129.46 TRINITY_DN677_c0_g3_i1:66-1235(+)
MKKRSHTILLDNSVDEDNLKATKKLLYNNDKELGDDVFRDDDDNIKRNKDDNPFKGLLDASNEMHREINLDYEPRLNLLEVLDEDDEEDEDYLPNVDQEEENEGDHKSNEELLDLNENIPARNIDLVENEEDDDIVIVRNNKNPIQDQEDNDEDLINEEIDDDDLGLDEQIVREGIRMLDESEEEEDENFPFEVVDKPQCPYGMNCYRTNPHIEMFSHDYHLEVDDLSNGPDDNAIGNVNDNILPQYLDLTDIDDDIVINPITNNSKTDTTANNNTNISNNSNDRSNSTNTHPHSNISRNTNNSRKSINNTNRNNTNNTNNNGTNNNHNVLDLTSDVIDLTDDSVTFLPPRNNNNHQRHNNRRIFSISSASNQIMDFMGINFMLMSNFF